MPIPAPPLSEILALWPEILLSLAGLAPCCSSIFSPAATARRCSVGSASAP